MEELKIYKDCEVFMISWSIPKGNGLHFFKNVVQGDVFYGGILKTMWMYSKFKYYQKYKWKK